MHLRVLVEDLGGASPRGGAAVGNHVHRGGGGRLGRLCERADGVDLGGDDGRGGRVAADEVDDGGVALEGAL